MEENHLSLEILAKLLSGRLEHEELLDKVVPHLLARCPGCRENHRQLMQMKDEVGHWDEEVALHEGREAPQLLELLGGHPYEEQLRLAEEDEDLHAWGLCQLLLRKSRATIFDDPSLGVDYATLAVQISGHLGAVYDHHWVLDLRARAFAYLGNARRVLGELRSAEDAFFKAARLQRQSLTGNTLVEAELLDLKSSLRRGQRRLPEALDLIDRALTLYRENRCRRGVGAASLTKGKILEESGEQERAIEVLREGLPEIDDAGDPRLPAYARCNLLHCLIRAERYAEAEQLLPEVRARFAELARPLDQVRLRWVEGNLDAGLGRAELAEAAFHEVQGEFVERRMGYDAALVSLDLAALYAQAGRTEDLKRLAGGLMPIFESREVHREALVALLMFQHACEEERLTAQLARHLAAFLRRERSGATQTRTNYAVQR
ncbi:MAG TPA: hypothetical protein VHR45_15545 [Thermoanaerobaculia bacterium]|nr:hypothetical protein [Thermoanaerobaculia bacterium]